MPSSRRFGLYVVLAVAVVGLYAAIDPTTTRLLPQCGFRQLTGLSCPGCGTQRALHAALHGHWAEAVAYNGLLLVAVPYALLLVGLRCWPRHRRLYERLTSFRAGCLYAFVALAWGVVRNVVGW